MRDRPLNERPRERCLQSGARALSLRECLALIINSGPRSIGCMGLAKRILDLCLPDAPERDQMEALVKFFDSPGTLSLLRSQGIGPAASARLLAALELIRRHSIYPLRASSEASRGEDSLLSLLWEQIAPNLRADTREWLGFVTQERSGRWGNLILVEHGVRTHVNTDPTELFGRLLPTRPRAFVLIHNHPSGQLEPSASDYELTQRVRDLARPFGIQLTAHLIVTRDGYRAIDRK